MKARGSLELNGIFMKLTDTYVQKKILSFQQSWNFVTMTTYEDHKGTLNKYGEVGIAPCILSDNNGIKITLSRAIEAIESLHRLNSTLLNDN